MKVINQPIVVVGTVKKYFNLGAGFLYQPKNDF
jgi:hypothetical protein